jgi:HAE1 family hydrophobic/amphiphilic exporter-1
MNLVGLSIRRPIFITCIFTLVIAVGVLSLKSLPVDLFPDVTFPVVMVSTPYPGAGPKEVETLISKVLESELSTIAGIKNIRSTNKDGISVVVAEFTLKTDVKYAEQQVRDKVSSAKRKLPTEVLESTIRRMDPSDQPIAIFSVNGPGSPAELFDIANEVVKPRLQQVEQVGLVEILGGRKREIRVELDQVALKKYQITASQVAERIRAVGENIPAGKVTNEKSELTYRTIAEFSSLADIGQTIVSFIANENPIRVKDLGRVTDTLEDETSRTAFNGTNSLVIYAFRQSGANTIQVVDGLMKKMDEINGILKSQGKNYQIAKIRESGHIIKANVEDVKDSILIGILLTIIVVLFFLGNFRSMFITSLALPNSLLGAFILMSFAGFSINIMSLLALSLAVGLLIDDAIVVRENIFRHIEMGKSPQKAALDGTLEVTLAVIATTATVIAVFGPIGFLDGVVGQFFKQFGLTICFAMIISLFDALTMAPMMSAYFAGKMKHHQLTQDDRNDNHSQQSKNLFTTVYDKTLGASLRGFDRLQTRLEDGYEKVLKVTLNYPKSILFMGLMIFVFSLFALKFVSKTFLPPQDNGEFNVKIELDPGSSLNQTQEMAVKIENVIRSNPEIDRVLRTVGSRDQEQNVANFMVMLVPSKQRNINTSDLKEKIRAQLVQFKEVKPVVGDIDMVGGGQRPFNLTFTGTDLDQLQAYTQKVFDSLKNHPALKDVEYGFKAGKPEFQIVIDQNKAESFGVSSKIAGAELRTLVEGIVPAVFRQNGIEYDVRVRLQENQRDLKNHIDRIVVPNINMRPVSLNQIATTQEKIGPTSINRKNRARSITIASDISATGPGMGGAMQDIKKMLEEGVFKLPEGISYAFEGQAENFQELLINMIVAMGLGILFIYLVLASLYESFIIPFTIMLVLPLAICGAFYALLMFHKTLDLFSMIGCVMLLGVATKNSILLVDYTNQLIEGGMDQTKAIITAGKTRLRPILMTSFALIAGMLPVAIGLNEASKQRTSMGVAIIGGLISSTLLTLVIVPAAFGYFEKLSLWTKKIFKKVAGSDFQEKN